MLIFEAAFIAQPFAFNSGAMFLRRSFIHAITIDGPEIINKIPTNVSNNCHQARSNNSLAKAANVLKEMGALSVRACATHPVFSGPAYERIAESALEEVIVSDTIPLSDDPSKDKSKITVLSMTKMFADIINKVYNYEEISSSFIN